jgi:hypothetical protein
MWLMLFAHVKAGHARLIFDNVVRVGAEDINEPKEQNYLMVLMHLMTKRVLFASPGNDSSVWDAFAA